MVQMYGTVRGRRKKGNPRRTVLGPPPESTCTRTGGTSCGHRWISVQLVIGEGASSAPLAGPNVAYRRQRERFGPHDITISPISLQQGSFKASPTAVTCEAVLQIGYTFIPDSIRVYWSFYRFGEKHAVLYKFGTSTRSSAYRHGYQLLVCRQWLDLNGRLLTHEKQRRKTQRINSKYTKNGIEAWNSKKYLL